MHYLRDIAKIESKLKQQLGDVYPEQLPAKGEKIRAARKALGLSQAQLAKDCGVAQPTISRAEKLEQKRTETTALLAIAAALGKRLREIAVVPRSHRVPEIHEPGPDDWRQLKAHIQTLAGIRTLIRPNGTTDLRSVYYRTELIEDRHEYVNRFTIGSLRDIESSPAAILGIAGQGKSVLLRFLAIQEIENESTVPVLVELRELGKIPLLETVISSLRAMGLNSDGSDPTGLLQGNSVSLLLDAFDEVAPENRPQVIRQIQQFSSQFSSVQIVVSSRPDSGLANQSAFHLYSIATLQPQDIMPLVQRYAIQDEASRIQNRVDHSFTAIAETMKTPLLVVLLVIHFRYTDAIPESTLAFYRDLLDVLIRRHNLSASGPKREPQSELDIFELSRAFEALSFVVVKQHGDYPIHISDLKKCLDHALRKLLRYDVSTDSVIEDILTITNLIVDEGGICTYLHRTIKEYYAAVFVRDASEEEAKRFYGSVIQKWRQWSGVLDFLEHIDDIRHLQLFKLPDMRRHGEISEEQILGMFTKLSISKSGNGLMFKFAECEAKTFDRFSPYASIDDQGDILADLFGDQVASKVAARIKDMGVAECFRDDSHGSQLVAEWDVKKALSELPDLAIDQLVEYATTFSDHILEFQKRESEFDV